jgi:hypothetical protein
MAFVAVVGCRTQLVVCAELYAFSNSVSQQHVPRLFGAQLESEI